ncbi:MAG: phasin family protein [Gammaproteobacteria bacterium]
MAKTEQVKQIEQTIAPFTEYNALVSEVVEKSFDLQMSTFEKLVKTGFENMNSIFNVKSAEDIKAYAEKQQTVAKSVAEMIVADATAQGELGKTFVEHSTKLIEKNIKMPKAA